MRRSPSPQALLTVRSALILTVSGIAGALTAALTLTVSGSAAQAALAALGGTAGAITLLNQIISNDPR